VQGALPPAGARGILSGGQVIGDPLSLFPLKGGRRPDEIILSGCQRRKALMITCERCRNQISENVAICPYCGTSTPISQPVERPPTNYGYQQYQQQSYMPPPQPDYGYGQPQQVYMPPPQPGYVYVPPQQVYIQQPGYGYPQPMYQPGGVNVTVVNTPNTSSTSSTPVLVEVLLNIFLGLFGVGWLMAGETTTGVVLLICGYLLYWPLFAVISFFTLGIGLLCLVPLHIGLLVLNPILLNNTLKRKAAQFVMVQPR
jgi:hypothetical protein